MSSNSQIFGDEPVIKVVKASKCYRVFKGVGEVIKHSLKKNRKKYYSEYWALHEISFQINKGEAIALVGQNGSGKSTLLQIICNTVTPTTGSVEVTGRLGALLELGSGFNPEFTGLENVYLNSALLGLSKRRVDEILPEILEFSEIGDYISQPVKSYSSGMLLRLAFSVIAFSDPEILVVDEALAVGDIFFQQKCLRRIRLLQDKGMTLLLVSHDESTVKTFCTRGIFLENGRSVFIGDIKECMDLYLRESRKGLLNPSTQMAVLSSSANQHNLYIEKNLAAASLCRVGSEKRFVADLGDKSVTIIDFYYQNSESEVPISAFALGANVKFTYIIKAEKSVEQPAIGYMIKNKNGTYVFSIESDAFFHSLKSLPPLREGSCYALSIQMVIPPLLTSVYSVDIAIANGKGDHHSQCIWIYDSHLLHIETKTLCNGIAGSMALSLEMQALPAEK